MKFYNRIITCFYDEEYTDDELYELGDQVRLLMDDELLENNSRDDYFILMTSLGRMKANM